MVDVLLMVSGFRVTDNRSSVVKTRSGRIGGVGVNTAIDYRYIYQ